MRQAGRILAYHDRSDGGLFVALCEMAFAGHCGVAVNLDLLTYAGNLANLADVQRDFPARYEFVKGDVCDKELVKKIFESSAIDAVVHFAAESHVDRSILGPESFVRTNVYGTFNLLETCRRFWLSSPGRAEEGKRFLHISTDEVYGSLGSSGYFTERTPYDPSSPYSASKAGGDLLVLAYHNSFGTPVTLTRGSNNIGPYQYPEKVVPLFITNAIDDEPLPLYGDGRQMRDYQYVLDHCEGIDVVLHRGEPGQVYNLGTGTETENIVLAHAILDLLGKPHSLIRHVTDRPGHDRRYSLNVDKVRALGWESRHSFQEGIEKTVRWYVANEWWWRKIKSGEYMDYYKRWYGERLASAE